MTTSKDVPWKVRAHTFEKHINCEKDNCVICDGGLSVCIVCHCAEGSLATECPGQTVGSEDQDRIYNGEIDFKNGIWIKVEKRIK